jgi:hypothetical protein
MPVITSVIITSQRRNEACFHEIKEKREMVVNLITVIYMHIISMQIYIHVCVCIHNDFQIHKHANDSAMLLKLFKRKKI